MREIIYKKSVMRFLEKITSKKAKNSRMMLLF